MIEGSSHNPLHTFNDLFIDLFYLFLRTLNVIQTVTNPTPSDTFTVKLQFNALLIFLCQRRASDLNKERELTFLTKNVV